MTLFQKRQDDLFNENSLRNRLKKADKNIKVIVTHNNDIVGIGYPEKLLLSSSQSFGGLLYKPIKNEEIGRALYLEV